MYHLEQRGISTVIHVDHDLDIVSAPALDASIRLAETDKERRVIVSLERCAYCDANGLTVLVRAKKRNGPNLTIVVPKSARCYRVFEVTGLSSRLSVFSSLDLALNVLPASLSGVAPWRGLGFDSPLRAAI
jgi:anti-sigma B factor antagonist